METYRIIPDIEVTYGIDCPYIDIRWQKGRIYLSNAVLRLIGDPNGILLLWNPDKRSLVVKPTHLEDPDGIPVIGKRYAQRGSLFVSSNTLIHKIWKAVDWDKTLRFRIVAKYNEPSNVAIFDMKNAVAFEIPKIYATATQKKE